ncbi:hypothetical protein GM418_21790 [Maribellus comscasis]|uniref:Outer membrane protein beta-barrel domain-containing protein n=1 Tax=Maribellus comscasis TaxID=2681766 RepID=A0A6I6K0W6_9BACT|nr:hypothetical protein [Maribellus comscasis]QGY46197.1 hypothetical protein GM418_21790 [Maribellus comscasis]
MKRHIILFLLVFSATTTFAQDDIKKEIIAFTDSTELIIRNGRKLLADKTISGDHDGAVSTLNYLKNTVDEKYIVLYPAEEILFSLANRNFELFLYNAKNWDSLLEGKVQTFQVESISDQIHQYLGTEMSFIMEDLDKSQLSEADKKVIRLYIRYYMNDDYSELNKSLKNYVKGNPDSEYVVFINQLRQLTFTGRMNFCLGYGNEFLNGNITDNFDSHMHIMNFEIDGFLNRLYLSLFMGGSVSREVSKNDMPVKDKNWTHPAGDKISSLKYGLKIGQSLYSTDKVNFYPYLVIGGYEINSQSSLADDNDSEPKNNLIGTFCPGVGASCDFVLKKWQSKNIYSPGGFLFLRPSVGYDYFLSNKEISKGGDLYFTVSLGVALGDI